MFDTFLELAKDQWWGFVFMGGILLFAYMLSEIARRWYIYVKGNYRKIQGVAAKAE